MLGKPAIILFGNRAIPVPLAVVPLDPEKLAKQLGTLLLQSIPERLLHPRPLARQPGVLEAVANGVYPRCRRRRQSVPVR
jgi:hypothetical protein